ncbi:MAG: DNA-binding protein [Desulfobulbaceae bacterium]|nr:DNA-binding protein [Desulfobulbaceae bacterium]
MAAFTACDSQKKEAQAPADSATKGAAVESQVPEVAFPLKGKAKEVLSGGGYTYILVAASAGDVWVAVPGVEVAVGEEVTVNEGQLMQNFPSRTLNRTFDVLYFAGGLEGKDVQGMPHGGAAESGHGSVAGSGDSFSAALDKEAGGATGQDFASDVASPGSGKAVVPFVDLKVAKAGGDNGYTVSELFAKAAELNGKKVRLAGQVVKFSPGIMGKNWLHLQDGSGDPNASTHDLVVTTSQEAASGDVVTVEGVLAADKDFGYGYKYNVIVEDVVVTK